MAAACTGVFFFTLTDTLCWEKQVMLGAQGDGWGHKSMQLVPQAPPTRTHFDLANRVQASPLVGLIGLR